MKKKNDKKRLIDIFDNYNILNYEIEYYPKMFGNIVCTFEYRGEKYRLITDRGEIIMNGKQILDCSYLNNNIKSIDMLEKIILGIIKQ